MTKSLIHRFLFAVAFALLMSSHPVSCKDQPYMELALEYLQQASAPAPQPSMLKPPEKIDRKGLLKSAIGALKKAPKIYAGRRGKALEYADVAIIQLNENQEKKAVSYINKAISEVREGIRIAK